MKDFIRVMKALSDPNRVKTIMMLKTRRMCVCELTAALGVAQPTVSNHLRVLEDAGLVESVKEGPWVNYFIPADPKPCPAALLDAMDTLIGQDPEIDKLILGLTHISREALCSPKRNGRTSPAGDVSSRKKVLFICVHNSGRSQMAEAYLSALAGDRFEAASAGFEPRPLNPLVVEVMAEDGIDISANESKSVFELFKAGRIFDYVVTVCDDSHEGLCPVFPGVTKRLHIPFDDPAGLVGSKEEMLATTRTIRDLVKTKVQELVGDWDSDNAPRKPGRPCAN